jgi:hypothetical protein
MHHKSYFLNTEKKEKLDLTWEGSFKNYTVKLDNKELGVFKNKNELKKGRSFIIGYNKKLEIRLLMQLGFVPCIEILFNDKPVPGTATDPKKQLAGIFYFIIYIAVLFILAGLTGFIFDIKAFDDHGIGLNSIIYGTLFIMMALILKKRESMFALLAVISLLALDIVFILVHIAEYGIQLSNPWPTIIIRLLFILYLCKGFTVITKIKQQDLIEMEQARIEREKKQKIPLSEQRTDDHTSFMPKDNSKYLPDN